MGERKRERSEEELRIQMPKEGSQWNWLICHLLPLCLISAESIRAKSRKKERRVIGRHWALSESR